MSDIIISRNSDGNIEVNVPHSVIHHSPTGFEIGYGGSGPADLALNILQHYLPGEQVKCYEGKCSQQAWILHQPFKWRFITKMDKSGGVIKDEIIKDWIKEELRKLNNEV